MESLNLFTKWDFNWYLISLSACADPLVGVVPIGLLRMARSESISQSLSSSMSPRELVSPGNSLAAGRMWVN